MTNFTYYRVYATDGATGESKNFKNKENAVEYFKYIANNDPNYPVVRDRKTGENIATEDFNNYTVDEIIDKVYIRAYGYYYIETAEFRMIEFAD